MKKNRIIFTELYKESKFLRNSVEISFVWPYYSEKSYT